MPDWGKYVRTRLRPLDLPGPREAEMVEELSQHLESCYEEALASGSSPEEAFARTADLFPDAEALSRELRLAGVARHVCSDDHDRGRVRRRWPFGIVQDLRFGLRGLGKSPAFTAICLLTLAVGIGANAVIFSIVDAVLVKPLPYRDADRLVLIRADVEGMEGIASLSAIELLDFRERTELFEDFAGVWSSTAALTGLETPEQIHYAWATRNLHAVLGVEPLLGRSFTAEEEAPNGPAVVILSGELWRRHYGADPDILGRSIEIDDRERVVVGVLPPGFRLLMGADTDVSSTIDAWVPQTYWVNRGMRWLRILGQLEPGVSIEAAQAEMDAVAANLSREFPEYDGKNLAFHVVPLHHDLVRDVEPAMLALFGAVGFVLLIACTNVANLLLTRTRQRSRELALRTALGASRWRVTRQVLTESALLAVLGGGLGIVVGELALLVLPAIAPSQLPRLDEVTLDARAVGFTFTVCLVACFAFGLLPALRGSRLRVHETLREGGRSGDASLRPSLRDGLVVAEVAISFVLLIGAGLMVRTLTNLQKENVGFQAQQVLTMEVPLSFDEYDTAERRWGFYRELKERIEAQPGVRAAGAVSLLPLGGGLFTSPYAYDAASERDFGALSADYRTVVPGYFRTMRARLLEGRYFDDADSVSGQRVVIIDDTLAEEAWPAWQGRSAIGKRLKVDLAAGVAESSPEWMDVIGIVEHLRHETVTEDGRPQIYFPAWLNAVARVAFVVRADAEMDLLASSAQDTVREMGSRRPVHTIRTMEHYLDGALSTHRFIMTLMLCFSGVALLLAVIGVYGVIAFAVNRRRHELGVRIALGAEANDLIRMLLRHGAVLALIGSTLGLFAAMALGSFLEGIIFGVTTRDPMTFAAVFFVLFLVSLLACAHPALRAARVDPTVALRHE